MVHKSAAMDFLLLRSIAAGGGGGHDFQLSDILLLLIHISKFKLPLVYWSNLMPWTEKWTL